MSNWKLLEMGASDLSPFWSGFEKQAGLNPFTGAIAGAKRMLGVGKMSGGAAASLRANLASSKAVRGAATAAQATPSVTGTTRGFGAGKQYATTLPNASAARVERRLDVQKGIAPVPLSKPKNIAPKTKTPNEAKTGVPSGKAGGQPASHWTNHPMARWAAGGAAAGTFAGLTSGTSNN